MRTGVIYLYTFPNGKVYVGQTRRDLQTKNSLWLSLGKSHRLQNTNKMKKSCFLGDRFRLFFDNYMEGYI